MVGFGEALTAITTGLNVTKELVSINHEFDKAELKLKAAGLMEALATVKAALVDAKEDLQAKDQKIRELEAIIETLKLGESCPICGTGRMKVTASKAHPHFAFAGVQERTLTCQNPECKHTEKRMHDPDNRTRTNR